MKNFSINFATFLQGTNFLTFVCVVFFIATNTAINAAIIGYHSDSYYTERSVIVPCRTEKGSLSSFKYFNFSFMQGTMKNQSGAKYSNTPLTLNSAKTVSEQFFTERNASLFKHLLNDAESYSYYLKSLWVFRELLEKKWDSEGESLSNPIFPLLKTVNELIGCLHLDNIYFDKQGDAFKIVGNKREYLSKKL